MAIAEDNVAFLGELARAPSSDDVAGRCRRRAPGGGRQALFIDGEFFTMQSFVAMELRDAGLAVAARVGGGDTEILVGALVVTVAGAIPFGTCATTPPPAGGFLGTRVILRWCGCAAPGHGAHAETRASD